MPKVYVLDVPEFRPLVDYARTLASVQVDDAKAGYFTILSAGEIIFDRKAMNMKPAVWYGAFTGGIEGEIAEFGRQRARIVPTNLTY